MLLDLGFVALGFALLATIWRSAAGPTDADRAAGADVAFFVLIAGMALLAVRQAEPVFIDVVLVATLVGFVATVALAHLVDRRTGRGTESRADAPDDGGAR